MTIDLNGLSARELESLIAQAKKRKTALNKRKPLGTVRDKLTAWAQNEGYTLFELFGGRSAGARTSATRSATKKTKRRSPIKGRKLGKVPAKYRNPSNSKETWSGRGKQPRWMAALTKKGKKPEDFLIKR